MTKRQQKEEFQFLRRMSDEAASRGVTLAMKPHVGASVYNTATMIQMLEAIDSPGLGANLDTLHIFRAREDAAVTVRELGKKLVHVHLRDYPDVPDRENYECRPEEEIAGRGSVDFPKILRSLKAIGYDGAVDLILSAPLPFLYPGRWGLAAETQGLYQPLPSRIEINY